MFKLNDKENSTTLLSGEEIVITGISGVFPESEHVINFKENLYEKVNMVPDKKRMFNHPELPMYSGKINDIDKFDAQFFRVHYKQAIIMDPMTKKLLEHAYGAIYDAGFNPADLRGKKIGVFIGASIADAEKAVHDEIQRSGFGITGNVKSMHSNRISYWLDAKGPSYSVDMNCASSAACLEHAYRSIKTGQCEAAIVGGCNVILNPMLSINFSRAGFLCTDGKTKCFDKNGDGYVRSDAVNVVFLQKSKHAKRIYCELYFTEMNYNLKADSEFLPTRPVHDITDFLKGVYSKIDVSPKDVEYVEANACGIARVDGNELEAIGNFFANQNAMKVGSVKSNMGHGEATSGLCSLTKMCLAYQEGIIPANLHYYEPQDHIHAVSDGKIEILQENTPFNRGFTAINCFSYGGANVHVLLKGHYKPKDNETYKTSLPSLILASGRQISAVFKILDAMERQPLDPELIGLLHDIHSTDISGHTSRGFSVLITDKRNVTVSLAKGAEYWSGIKRPVWFLYSGMGSQWMGMGAKLMRIPSFASAINRCREVLLPKGVDVLQIIMEKDETIFKNILNSFVGIAAVQIGLTDLLSEMGIVPDNIIGHSVGELGCAYADGCLTAEEMILSAYYRGLVSIQTSFICGSMAAVGLGYADIAPICPPDIDVACHNSNESCTISGPAESVNQFVMDLKKRNIFAKEVLCSNIAYHSRYISEAGPGLLKYMRNIFKEPKLRSEKWVSTSVPMDKWNESTSKFSSAEYFTNNLLNPVLFEETSKLIPQNALVIEIAPHGLLQAILKKSLNSCLNISLTRKNHENPIRFFLESIGKLYMAGLNPKVSILYPKIQYPVSTSTGLLSHLVEWNHSEDWPQAPFKVSERIATISRDFVITLIDEDYNYLKGYTRNGKKVIPEAALIVFVWETLAMSKGMKYTEMPVIFSDIQFFGEAVVATDDPLRLSLYVSKGTNRFQVKCRGNEVATGFVYEQNTTDTDECENPISSADEELSLSSKCVYRLLYHKGYCYNQLFQTICHINSEYSKAHVKWNGNWVSFIDGLLQLHILNRNHAGVSVPKFLNMLKISIDIQDQAKRNILWAEVNSHLGYIKCGSVELRGLYFTDQQQVIDDKYEIQSKIFTPHHNHKFLEIHALIHTDLQIISQNILTNTMQVVEICGNQTATILSIMKTIFKNSSKLFDVDAFKMEQSNFHKLENSDVIADAHLIIVSNLFSDVWKMKKMFNVIKTETFILTIEENSSYETEENIFFTIITAYSLGSQIYILLRKKEFPEKIKYLSVSDSGFARTLETIKQFETPEYIMLVSENDEYHSLFGIVNNLRKKFPHKINLLIIDDHNALKFDPNHPLFMNQIHKRLTLNIFKQGYWGGYYYQPCINFATPETIKLISSCIGSLDSLIWVEDKNALSNICKVKVAYAGLSRRDVQIAIDESVNSGNKEYGMDFSGMNISNEKVMGLVSSGAIGNVINAEGGLLWPVPCHWTLEDAATVPLPYVLAFYCLNIRSETNRGNRVFVSRGLGSLGQAVISICLAQECEVFTTVSSLRRKNQLLRLFPKLKESNVLSSRNEVFYEELIEKTNGCRCNTVISSFTGNLRKAAIRCVGMTGKFIDLSYSDMEDNKPFGMYYLEEDKSYARVDLSQFFKPSSAAERQTIQEILAIGIMQGYVKPLIRVVFSPDKITKAFQFTSNSENTGRVLLKMSNVNKIALDVHPRVNYHSKSSFIIFCDNGDIGFELADRLIERNVRNILLVKISYDVSDEYVQTKIASWKRIGVKVKVALARNLLESSVAEILKVARTLGPIHGIYYIQPQGVSQIPSWKSYAETTLKFTDIILFLKKIDLISRNLCPELHEFVVITKSPKNSDEEYVACALEGICQRRNEIKIPALYFRTQLFNEYDHDFMTRDPEVQPQDLKINSVLNALETSLSLQYNNVITFPLKDHDKETDFVHNISKILGFKFIDNIPDEAKFSDISIDENVIGQIRSLIKNQYNINHTMDTILGMTISDLKSLSHSISAKKVQFDRALHAFYTYFEENECLGYDPVVPMVTLLSNADEKEDELYQESEYLMLIPGFEGHHQIFNTVCERLKVHAMTFQIAPNLVNETIQQIAEEMFKIMRKRFNLKSKFYILGYSFGVNVALELAALLEKSGFVGVVYCLDSSPDALRIHLNTCFENKTESEIQNEILEHMYNIMSRKPCKDFKKDFDKLECWTDKVLVCINKLHGLVNCSKEFKRAVIESVYRRILLSLNYEPDFTLESQLVLMRGISHPNAHGLPLDYNLSKYTKQPIKILDLESDHAMAPQDLKVPNIINEFLDKDILEKFARSSLCETYLLDKKQISL